MVQTKAHGLLAAEIPAPGRGGGNLLKAPLTDFLVKSSVLVGRTNIVAVFNNAVVPVGKENILGNIVAE
jgi:hypothetical protein